MPRESPGRGEGFWHPGDFYVGLTVVAGLHRDEGKAFFFGKKKQKTFVGAVAEQTDRGFLVLFRNDCFLRRISVEVDRYEDVNAGIVTVSSLRDLVAWP